MKKKLIALITIGMLLLASCTATSIPSSTIYESNAPESIQTPTPIPQLKTEVVPVSVTPQVTELPTPEPTEIYKGAVEHIFFHPLIAYPERAFDGDSMAQGYSDWFITVPEFKKIIKQLYNNNYILIDIRSLYQANSAIGVNGIVLNDLKLPKGKKPLILSIDDLNYYDYMIDNGNVSKLVTNPAGDVFTESVDSQGNKVASVDNEIVPILDSFVREHPDFSDHGAKGVIALTGYQGILGYRTNDEHADIAKAEQVEAVAVIQRLKETGWSFASHGWGHLDAVKVSTERFIKDTERWKREVEPLIGPTSIYIYPYGSRVETDSAKFNALKKLGFNVFLSVGPGPYLKLQSGVLMMDRRHIDGMALLTQRTKLLALFDSNDIIDPIRLKGNKAQSPSSYPYGKLEENAEIKLSQKADLFGSGKEATIALIQLPLVAGQDYSGYLGIWDKENKLIQKFEVKGYDIQFPIQIKSMDITGDEKPDLILETDVHANGGLGAHALHIYVQENSHYKETTLPDGINTNLTVKYDKSSHNFMMRSDQDKRIWNVQWTTEQVKNLDSTILSQENTVSIDPISSIDLQNNILKTKSLIWFGNLQLNELAILVISYHFEEGHWSIQNYTLESVDKMSIVTEQK